MSRRPIDIPLPDLTGRRALVTGGSDGIGLRIATRLAAAGAEVLLPVRDRQKGQAALARIREQHPAARITVHDLDLASLSSVESLADRLNDEGAPLNMLVANAGVMTPPQRRTTVDGFELQLGTNHLGHFALVGRLLPLLRAGSARVVSQVSVAADQGAVNWDDLNWEQRYSAMRAYSSSKIAVGLFGLELQRRAAAGSWGVTSDLAHPGVAPTSLLAARTATGRSRDGLDVRMIRLLSRLGLLVGTAETASLPALLAATSDGPGGQMYAPSGPGHLGGAPALQQTFSRVTDEANASRMWALSEEMTGVRFPR
jgi:NAD(P)-dependent dehydrogenase (short-subunit alcohol dehydrogenase family)